AEPSPPPAPEQAAPADAALVPARPEIYASVELKADLGGLSERQRAMLVKLIEAAQVMDDLFWRQAFREGHEAWLDTLANPAVRRYAELNYGPWDRLANDAPFVAGFGEKPLGANFYPADMTREEFD